VTSSWSFILQLTFRVSGDSQKKVVTWIIKISLTPVPLRHTLKSVIVNGSNITSRILRNVVIQQHSEAHTIHHQFTKHLNVINTPSGRRVIDCILKCIFVSWPVFRKFITKHYFTRILSDTSLVNIRSSVSGPWAVARIKE